MRKMLRMIFLLVAGALCADGKAADALCTWERLIGQEGCLASASDVRFTTEGSLFANKDWRAFFAAAAKDEALFRLIVDRFSSGRPTKIHICNFRNATEGEIAVFSAQRIVRKNWYSYDGEDGELKQIAGEETAAKVQLLKQVLENGESCAALRNYFLRQYKLKSADASMARLRAAAEKGDAASQFELGCRIGFGWGVKADKEAEKWFEQAAAQGHVTARGVCRMFGFGVGKELEEAEKLFRVEAEKGDAWAQLLLGLCRLEKRDVGEAVGWFGKSALQGNAVAQYRLAERYSFGEGAEKNLAESEKWMKKSADQGYEPARIVLTRLEYLKRPPCGVVLGRLR